MANMVNVLTNHLNVEFHYDAIDDAYDFFMVTTSEKYIDKGALFLDAPGLDLKVRSITFDAHRSAFIMTKKGEIESAGSLIKTLADQTLSAKQVKASDIKDYILFRLSLYSLSNFSNPDLSFNNLTGKFYVYSKSMMATNGKSFKALAIDVDQDLNLQAPATTFSYLGLFGRNYDTKGEPLYTFSFMNHSLRRLLPSEPTVDAFIKKKKGGGKTEYKFLDLSRTGLIKNKCYLIFQTIAALKKRFTGLFDISFQEKEKIKAVETPREKKINELAVLCLRFKKIVCVNWDKDEADSYIFTELVHVLQDAISVSAVETAKEPQDGAINIVFFHDEDHYLEHKYHDPYLDLDRSKVIQCVTVEESSGDIIDHSKAVIGTIIKEALIKDDIINGQSISLDRWSEFGFTSDWIFGIERNGVHYFMRVHPDGSFSFVKKRLDFSPFLDQEIAGYSKLLSDSEEKTKTLVADASGNVILISRTEQFTLPSEEVFTAESIRSAAGRAKYLSGVTDICMYEDDNGCYYSVGLIGNGMNSGINNTAHLYKVTALKGKNIIEDILATMSVTFVKMGEFTVLPYPVKYLREYALIMESPSVDKKKTN
jgi:hypothetical protein